MIRKSIIGAIILSIWIQTIRAQKTIKSDISVEITITQTEQYCGGAAPPKEMLDELNRPKPYVNKTLYIRKDTNDLDAAILYKLTTDTKGKALVKLKPGRYSIVDENKKDRALYNSLMTKYKEGTERAGPIDQDCLMRYMSTPDFVVIVKKEARRTRAKAYFNYFHSCNRSGVPCAKFLGHYPQ